MIPDWANELLIVKGIGFERAEVKGIIWGYFNSQFGELDCEQKHLEMYFSHMIDELIKSGDVDRARKHFACNSYKVARPERQSQVFEGHAIKQDVVSEFEEKWFNYMNSNRSR